LALMKQVTSLVSKMPPVVPGLWMFEGGQAGGVGVSLSGMNRRRIVLNKTLLAVLSTGKFTCK